jgi:hypothetical protein
MLDLQWTNQVSVEGAATAVGVLGAATGYLINLIRQWRFQYINTRYRGTRLVILDLLEQRFEVGLTETELWEKYQSKEMEKKRKEYKAWRTSKFKDRVEFEREIRQLQIDRLIRLTSKDTYKVDADPTSIYDLKDMAKRSTAEYLLERVSRQELIQIVQTVLERADNIYAKKRAFELLMSLGDNQSADRLLEELRSSDTDTSVTAAETIADYLDALPGPHLRATRGLAAAAEHHALEADSRRQ